MPVLNVDNTTDRQIKMSRPVALRYNGFSLRETTGTAPAVVRIFDNTEPDGPVLDEIALAAGESAREFYTNTQNSPLTAHRGIYVQVVSGSVSGSVRYS